MKATIGVVLPPRMRDESHLELGSASLIREIALRTKGYYDVQAVRIAEANRIRQYGIAEPLWFKDIRKIERLILRELKKRIEQTPYASMLQIKGIGPLIIGGLLMHTYNFPNDQPCGFNGVRSLWHYAGQHVVDNKAPKERRGQKVDWSSRFRKWLIRVGQALIRSKGPYRQIYDEERLRSEKNPLHVDWNKGHHFNHAKRLMVKQLLKDWFVFGKPKIQASRESQIRFGFDDSASPMKTKQGLGRQFPKGEQK